MIKNYVVVGDQHGNFTYMLQDLQLANYDPETTAIIALGDFGLNFYLNKTDEKKKAMLQNRGYIYYLVRGNHEARPEDLPNIKSIWDDEICGHVWIEEAYPNIRYLKDGHSYKFGDYSCLVLGGAYSVDKEYRLLNKWPWFYNEMLTQDEMDNILETVKGANFDFILSHTCPISWEPRDLFLPMIDQSKVDKSMEKFLEEIEKNVNYWCWLFGHYHDDRLVRPGVEMFYHRIDNIEDIVTRWMKYEKTGERPEGYVCDPNFFTK